MLVLSRKQAEKLHIGDDITVSILEIRGRRVRIGIEAPDGLHIVRGELRDARSAESPRATVAEIQCVQPAELAAAC